MTDLLPVFKSDQERADWIEAHVDYYTVIMRLHGHNQRKEFKTLEEAEKEATKLAREWDKYCIIYAVGPMGYSAYIKTIKPEGH